MRILMFTWEFPPLITGGLGTACYGIVRALLKQGIEVDLVLPTKEEVYFPLRKKEDVDILPVLYLDEKKKIGSFDDIESKLKILGFATMPETYISTRTVEKFEQIFLRKTNERYVDYIDIMKENVVGEEGVFRKVKELAVRARNFARKLDFDFIHVHDWLTFPAGVVSKNETGKKLVAHIHATEFDRSTPSGDERIHKIEYSGLNSADRVIAVSNYTADMIIRRYMVPPRRINVVHNAHEAESFDRSNKKRVFKGPCILFLGRITLQKGPDYFLEVAKRILSKHPDARFIMAGAGDMRNKILHRSANYRLKNKFLFSTGFLKRKEVQEIFSISDIFILSSVSEPFGIVPLEAMSYGIPAIISKQSGVSEVLENAIKVDFWDIDKMVEKIEFLLQNTEKRKEIGEKGKQEIERMCWDNAAEKIKYIYEELS